MESIIEGHKVVISKRRFVIHFSHNGIDYAVIHATGTEPSVGLGHPADAKYFAEQGGRVQAVEIPMEYVIAAEKAYSFSHALSTYGFFAAARHGFPAAKK